MLTRRGNPQWSLGSIQLILRNPVYVGYFDYTDKMVGETVRIQTPPIIDAQCFQNAQDRRKGNLESKGTRASTKHFYLLRGVLFCGHCGSPMGGRTHKKGHQNVYYCVKKERNWVTREENHPKWKRGTGCSMVRSVNIERTNQLVWSLIKSVLQRLRDRSPRPTDPAGPDRLEVNDADRFTTEGLTWLSAEQVDLLSDDDKRTVITELTSRISVHFDQASNKHSVDVELSETVSRLLADRGEPTTDQRCLTGPDRRPPQTWTDQSEDSEGDDVGKKHRGSWASLAAENDHSVTVE